MIAIDTNVLVYAHRLDLPDHREAAAAVDGALAGGETVGLPWPVLHEFLAVVTNPRAFVEPTPFDVAVGQAEHWLSSPMARALGERPGHLRTLASVGQHGRVAGGAVHDARIAAICIDEAVRELWTVDRDFGRYPVTTRNPLASAR